MRVLAIVHVYYRDRWPELAACLRHVAPDTLIITAVDAATAAEAQRTFPSARILLCENRGYDVGPFLEALATVDLAAYDLVVKLHTKRDMPERGYNFIGSTRLDGSAWRDYLLAFVRTPEAWARTLRRFDDPRIGMVADRHIIFTRNDTSNERHRASFDAARRALQHRFSLEAPPCARYVGGTMFAVRASLLAPFCAQRVTAADFTRSVGHDTETQAHVMERMLGLAVAAQGYRLAAFCGSVAWHRWAQALLKLVYEDRQSPRRRTIRIFGITVFRKKQNVSEHDQESGST